MNLEPLLLIVQGRPAPQGSKQRGQYGQLREQSAYLPAWRAAVKRAAYEEFRRLGVPPEDLPYFRGPVSFSGVFCLDTGSRIDGPPDYDKLLRSTWDALGCGVDRRGRATGARVWEDDSRVVELREPLLKVTTLGFPGAVLLIRAATRDG